MAIELSSLTFTEQDDIVPVSGMEEIVNTGIVNTLAGTDLIIGTGNDYGFRNEGTLNTDDGNDVITGTGSLGLRNEGTLNTDDGNDIITGTGSSYGIITFFDSTLDTGKGNDVITGSGTNNSSVGFANMGTSNTGDGNDIITGTGGTYGFENLGTLNTDDGNDTITGTGTGIQYGIATSYGSTLDTGKGNDVITGINSKGSSGFINRGTLNTGDGQDSIISHGAFNNIQDYSLGNGGEVFLGNGDDSIIIINPNPMNFPAFLLTNTGIMETGNGDDTIVVDGYISTSNIINTGNGNDFIFSQQFRNFAEVFLGNGNDIIISSGIISNEATINTGNGNDFISANEGFKSGLNIRGSVFLGEGKDYIKGFGTGDFYGEKGQDTLELTPGSYTLEISPAGWNFAKNGIIMNTVGFEKLIAGSTSYDFTSLTNGQIIIVA